MGVTAVHSERGDIDKAIAGMKEALQEALASKKA